MAVSSFSSPWLRAAVLAALLLPGAPALGQGAPGDLDFDGVLDEVDVCPRVYDPSQTDSNGNGRGDACECGDSNGDGLLDVRDWALLARCVGSLGACAPLCDVTDDAACDAADPPPLRGHLVRDVSDGDLVCPQQPAPDVPLMPDEEDPPVIEFDPLLPGSIRDDPLDYGTDDFSQDPGPDPRRPPVGATIAHSGDRLDFITAATPTDSAVRVGRSIVDDIIDTGTGRYAEIFVGPLLVRVIGNDPPPVISGPTPDAELVASTHALEDLELTTDYEVGEAVGGGQQMTVQGFEISDALSGAPLDTQGGFDIGILPQTCEEKAVFEYHKTGPIPLGMPKVKFPSISGCTDDECVLAYHGWLAAHHNAWRFGQMIDFADAQTSYYRSFIWGQPGLKQNGQKASEQSAPEFWFGHYAGYRFDAIDNGKGKLRTMHDTLKTGASTIELYCPSDPGNVCFTTEASAHHIIRSDIALCDRFFDLEDSEGNPRTYWFRSHVLTHELMHHRDVDFTKDNVAKARVIQDTHIHGHGNACVSNVSTKKFYGFDNVRELATYFNLQKGNCKHREKGFGNNDTWAFAVTRIGDMVHRQQMWQWPAPAEPTPMPPDCGGQTGIEGCQCDDTFPFGEGSDPDGDYRIDKYCPDNVVPLECMQTKFNASDIVGICVDCDEMRGPGCECDNGLLCDVGECFGEDTFGGGGTGRCYQQPIKPWVCLADCERLYNDSGAWCWHEDTTGRARCYDSGCSEPEADACIQQGKVCRDSQCIVECNSQQDCLNWGYPPAFICTSSRCEFPL